MEREAMKNNGEGVCRTNPETTTTTDFVLQWGSRKRLRCIKIQVKKGESTDNRTTVRVDRRVVRTEKDSSNRATTISTNSRRLSPSSPPPPPSYRILRNSEPSCGMKGQSNGVRSSFSSLDRGDERAQDKKANNHNHSNSNHRNGDDHNNAVAGASASSETAHDIKKGNSSSGSDAIPVWPPKFVISLTNKEKEEDFLTFKGSKLPQRPKKRAKFIQRTLNLVCPGSWLCDLTLERYEVREKKISKKRPRGLKAMGNMDSESE